MDKKLGRDTGFFSSSENMVLLFFKSIFFRFYAEKRYFFTLDNGNIRLEIIARKERDAWKQQKY
ncbi:hypothetical protein BA1_05732 [Bacillus xiamenensis]|nr:hypothetical protein BA1_05732 [Bacillus xiamenensis]